MVISCMFLFILILCLSNVNPQVVSLQFKNCGDADYVVKGVIIDKMPINGDSFNASHINVTGIFQRDGQYQDGQIKYYLNGKYVANDTANGYNIKYSKDQKIIWTLYPWKLYSKIQSGEHQLSVITPNTRGGYA